MHILKDLIEKYWRQEWFCFNLADTSILILVASKYLKGK